MSQGDFNPKSPDAMFATVLSRLDEQDRSAGATRNEMLARLDRIEEQTRKTNGRVTKLETERAVTHAKVITLASVVSVLGTVLGWYIEYRLR